MKTINIQEAKTHLSRLIAQVAGGETIVISKAGAPVAVLSQWQPHTMPRSGGGWAGKAWISPDFDAPDAEVEALFSGEAGSQSFGQRVAETPPKKRP